MNRIPGLTQSNFKREWFLHSEICFLDFKTRGKKGLLTQTGFPGNFPGEELGLIESQETKESRAANSSSEWSNSSVERELLAMERQRRSTETEDRQVQSKSPTANDKGMILSYRFTITYGTNLSTDPSIGSADDIGS